MYLYNNQLMRILEFPAYFYPESMSSAHLDETLRQAIVDAGMEMTIYCPTPTRGITPEERKAYKKRKLDKMYDGHVTVHRFSLYGEGKNPVLRALRYTLSCVMQFNRAVFAKDARRADVMYITSTPPIKGAMAGLAKKFNHKPIVYNLQDIFPDSLVGSGLAKKGGLLWRIGRAIEDFTYRSSDKIIVISEDFKKNIMAKGVPEDKIVVVYNWVDENVIVPVKEKDNDLFEEFGVSRDKFRVVYAGNLGNAQNIEIIIDAARKLKDNPKIEFVIFGKGGMENEIKQIKANEQLDNLKILPLQPFDRVAKVYGLGHLCIVACKPGLGGAAMPSKTWSIMSSGRAVLANFDEGELKEIVENNHCGAFTKAGDLEAFLSTIENLSLHPEQCAEMGANGRQFILENLTRAVGTQKYVNVIKSVLKQ